MTALAPERNLTALTDDELSRLHEYGTDADRVAVRAECERQDRARRARRAWQSGTSGQAHADWESAAYAQYLQAEERTRGNLLSEAGKRAGRDPWPMLWQGSEEGARKLASDELLCMWDYESPRPPGPAAYAAQRRNGLAAAEQEGERGGDMITATADEPAVSTADRMAAIRQRAERAAAGLPGDAPRPSAVATSQVARRAFHEVGGVLPTVPAGLRAVPYRADDGMEITGAEWLDYMRMFFARYVYWPSDAALDTAVLWAAHTYARESPENGAGLIFDVTPRFFALSSERNSGKSTVMALFWYVCPRAFGIDTEPTEYGLLESIETEKPTVLIDELGILIGSDKRKAGVQQILLNGYTPRGTKLRQKNKQANRVQLFAPIALAGLDVVEKTASENVKAILSRGPIIHMQPAPDNAEPADLDEEKDRVAAMVRNIQIAGMGWTITNREFLRTWVPEPAEGAHRRWRQIWRPMLTIADGAGGDWPERARVACVKLQHGFAGADDKQLAGLADMKAELAAHFGGKEARP